MTNDANSIFKGFPYTFNSFIPIAVYFTLSAAITLSTCYYTWVHHLDPMLKKRRQVQSKLGKVLDRLGIKKQNLNEYEEIIATEVIFPEDISTTFEDIGGLDLVISNLRETVILPLCHAALLSHLISPPKGILLYGPPGCGKTMLAKAIAKESGATFINLHISTLMDKWYGESQKLVHGVFTLAKKLQPCIVFIDEIDCFLRERSRSDHESTGMMKAEFMTLWDGLGSGKSNQIAVLGATNRPNDLDQAILRRMPKRYHVGVPDLEQRQKVLNLILKQQELNDSLTIRDLAKATAGYSCSDLKELCRNAAYVPVQEWLREQNGKIDESNMSKIQKRPLNIADFFPKDQTGVIHGADGSLTGKLDLD